MKQFKHVYFRCECVCHYFLNLFSQAFIISLSLSLQQTICFNHFFSTFLFIFSHFLLFFLSSFHLLCDAPIPGHLCQLDPRDIRTCGSALKIRWKLSNQSHKKVRVCIASFACLVCPTNFQFFIFVIFFFNYFFLLLIHTHTISICLSILLFLHFFVLKRHKTNTNY